MCETARASVARTRSEDRRGAQAEDAMVVEMLPLGLVEVSGAGVVAISRGPEGM
jgi:acetolactate synthase small subunit